MVFYSDRVFLMFEVVPHVFWMVLEVFMFFAPLTHWECYGIFSLIVRLSISVLAPLSKSIFVLYDPTQSALKLYISSSSYKMAVLLVTI